MTDTTPTKRTKAGRPKKKKLPRGRPKGMETVMKEYRMRMLNSPKSSKVLEAIFEVAMDSEHKHWPAASKMVLDRIAPAGGFSVNSKEGSKIEINISGLESPRVSTEEAIDVEFSEVDDEQ